MVLNMTNSKRVDAELLGKITEEIEKRAGNSTNQSQSPDSDTELGNDSGCTDPQAGRLRQTEHLVDSLGKILQQVCYFFLITLFISTSEVKSFIYSSK